MAISNSSLAPWPGEAGTSGLPATERPPEERGSAEPTPSQRSRVGGLDDPGCSGGIFRGGVPAPTWRGSFPRAAASGPRSSWPRGDPLLGSPSWGDPACLHGGSRGEGRPARVGRWGTRGDSREAPDGNAEGYESLQASLQAVLRREFKSFKSFKSFGSFGFEISGDAGALAAGDGGRGEFVGAGETASAGESDGDMPPFRPPHCRLCAGYAPRVDVLPLC